MYEITLDVDKDLNFKITLVKLLSFTIESISELCRLVLLF